MKKTLLEGIMEFICDYYWIILILLVIGLALYFTRSLWLPLLGFI